MVIATSRFSNKELVKASGLAPVAITLGAPRFNVGYLWGRVLALAPHGLFQVKDPVEFWPAYREHLDRLGAVVIERLLSCAWHDYVVSLGVSRDECPGVVVLCFEDVHKGDWCHRQVFAAWWTEQTGEPVAELA